MGFATRMSLGYAGVFAPLAVQLAFLPVWLKHVGFSASEIGTLLAVPLIARVFTTPPLVAAADRFGDRATFYCVAALVSLLASLGFFLPLGFWGVLTVSVAIAVASAIAIPVSDAIALSGVRRLGLSYGPMRLWGSVGFIVANLLVGAWIARSGANIVPFLLAVGFAIMLATGLALPRIGAVKRVTSRVSLSTDRALLSGMVVAALIIGSQAMYYGFSSIHWETLGFSGTVIGVLWGTGVVAEIVVFALVPVLFPRASPFALLIAGGVIGMVRWGTFSLDGGIGFYFLNSILHAGSFGLAHLGLQQLIAERVSDEQQSAAQGLAAAFAGPVMAIATFGSGWLYGRYGSDAFWAMAALCALGCLACRFAQPQSSGVGGETTDPE